MRYASRLIAKSRGSSSRLSPRQLPIFAPAEKLIEEQDDVLIPPRGAPLRKAPDALHSPGPTTRTPQAVPQPEPQGKRSRRARESEPDPQELVPAKPQPRVEVPEKPVVTRTKRLTIERSRLVYLRDRREVETDDAALDQPLIPATTKSAAPARSIVRPVSTEIARETQNSERFAAGDAPGSTVVNVVIGRIDVRAAEPEPKPKREEPFRPRLSLEAYLNERAGER